MGIEMGNTDGAAAVAAHASNSRSSPPPEGPGSAARQVFDLPELLENILLFVSTFAEPDNLVCLGSAFHKNPAKQLFVLQRVNSTFRATISRNRTMQQRMFLAPGPAEPTTSLRPYEVYESAHYSNHSSFLWLLDKVGVFNSVFELRGPPYNLHTSRGKARLSKNLMNKSSEASWRNMKLHCVEGCGSINLEYCTHWRSRVHMATFAEAGNMTLGKLHDGLQVLSSLAEQYNIAEYAEMCILEGGTAETDAAKDRLQHECDMWQW